MPERSRASSADMQAKERPVNTAQLHELFTTPSTYLILAVCSLLIGMSKMGFPGINIVTTPILIYLTDVRVTIALTLLLLYPSDIVAVVNFRKQCNARAYFRFMPWALAGVLASGIIGVFLSRTALLSIMSAFIFTFAGILIYVELRSISAARRRTLSAEKTGGLSAENGGAEIALTVAEPETPQNTGTAALSGPKKENTAEQKRPLIARFMLTVLAVLSGIASMLANASGPLTSLYLLLVGMKKKEFIGTGAFFYFSYNTLKMVILVFVWKTVTLPLFLYSLIVMPWSVLGAYVSKWISHYIPEHVYRWIIIFFIVLAGLSIVRLLF